MIKLGDTNVSKLYLGDTEIKKAYVGESLVFDNSSSSEFPPGYIPPGYVQVEYIQNSDRSSYINTHKQLNNSEFTIEISTPITNETGSRLYLFHGGLTFYFYTDSRKRLIIYLSKTEFYIGNMHTNKMIITEFENSVYVDDLKLNLPNNYTNSGTDIIFPYTSPDLSHTIRIYSFKATNSIYPNQKDYNFDLVPCINPDGIAGLYDLTNAEFIGPTAGTFIAGPEV